MFDVDFHILNQKATPAIYADTLANRPAASFAGRLFVDTASPYGIYRDTGSAWVQIASNGGGSGSTGINGLNGTTNIGLGGTLLNNTTISGNNYLYDLSFSAIDTFSFSSKNFILQCNDILSQQSVISAGNGSLSIIQYIGAISSQLFFEPQGVQSKFSGANFGILLDNSSGKFALGDYSNGRKYNSFVVNDDNDRIYVTTTWNQSNTDQDMFYISNNPGANERFIKLGDFNGYVHNTFLIIDDQNYKIYTGGSNGSPIGIDFDFINEIYSFGDSNNAIITCDNINQFIELTANNIILNNTPQINNATITNTASSTIPANYLSIQINGNNYKILLLNP
jgi:hypothetical protein